MVESLSALHGSGALTTPVFNGGVGLSGQIAGSIGGAASSVKPKGVKITQETGEGDFTIRPNFREKFRPQQAQALIHGVLQEQLKGQVYSSDAAAEWVKRISDDIKMKLKGLNLPRYKYIVSVHLGEMRGEGVQ